MTNLVQRIITYRTVNGLSQEAFAKRCGLCKSTITHLESRPDKVISAMTQRKIELVLMGGTINQKGE